MNWQFIHTNTAFSMNNGNLLLLVFILVLLALNPDDFLYAVEFITIKSKTFFLNYFLMYKAWLSYRLIAKECTKMGLPTPAFTFIPIWKRP